MKKMCLFFHSIMLILLVSSCCSIASENDENVLRIKARTSKNGIDLIALFSVRAVYSDGAVKEIGSGDLDGFATVEKKDLEEAVFLVICNKGFFCGAIDVKETHLIKFDLYSIDLAPFHT